MSFMDKADIKLRAQLRYYKVALREAIEYEELAGRPTRQLYKRLRRVMREERRVDAAEKRRLRAECRELRIQTRLREKKMIARRKELRIKVHTLEVLGRLEEGRL